MSDETKAWYDANARAYCLNTVTASMDAAMQRFVNHLPVRGVVLDLGCGSGRDARTMALLGYIVDARDFSVEMARHALEVSGVNVRIQDARDMEDTCAFDGVWACAVLLHLRPAEMIDVMTRIHASLKLGGVVYLSVKQGRGQGSEDGRFFCYWSQNEVESVATLQCGFEIVESWLSQDLSRPNIQWINVIARRPLGFAST